MFQKLLCYGLLLGFNPLELVKLIMYPQPVYVKCYKKLNTTVYDSSRFKALITVTSNSIRQRFLDKYIIYPTEGVETQ